MNRIAEVEPGLHGGEPYLQDAAVDLRPTGLEQAVDPGHEGAHAALGGRAEHDDLVAEFDAEVGGKGGAHQSTVRSRQILARGKVRRQIR